eukprot:sb/3467227/
MSIGQTVPIATPIPSPSHSTLSADTREGYKPDLAFKTAKVSFLAGIGYVMANSGLEEALGTIYSEEVVKKVMKGKQYARGVRAHGLVSSVLKKLLLDKLPPDLIPEQLNRVVCMPEYIPAMPESLWKHYKVEKKKQKEALQELEREHSERRKRKEALVDTIVSGWLHKVKGRSPEDKELERIDWFDRAHPVLRERMRKAMELHSEMMLHSERMEDNMVDTHVSAWLHKKRGRSPEEKELAQIEWSDRAHPILREVMKRNRHRYTVGPRFRDTLGERLLSTKSECPLNRGQIRLISYIGEKKSCP